MSMRMRSSGRDGNFHGRRGRRRRRPIAEGLEGRALLSVGLDPTWGFGGVAELNVPPNTASDTYSQFDSSIASQDGEVLVLGTQTETPSASGSSSVTNLIVTRLTDAGQLDTSFGSGGLATIPLTLGGTIVGGSAYSSPLAEDIAVQPDGSIDVLAMVTPAGSPTTTDFLVAQLTPSGSIDTTFGTAGGTLFNVGASDPLNADVGAAMALGPDGQIVVVGSAAVGSTSEFAVARLGTGGALDTSFNGDGVTLIAFNTGGSAPADARAASVVVQPDDAIVVAGSADLPTSGSGTLTSTPSDVAVARLTAAGVLDTSFNGTGELTFNENLGGSSSSDTAAAVTLSGSAIVIAGTSEQVFTANPSGFTPNNSALTVTELNADGSFDASFDGTGKYVLSLDQGGVAFNTTAAAVIARPSGALLVGGTAREQDTSYFGGPGGGLLLSLTPTGTPDTTFGTNGAAVIPEAVDSRLFLQSDGKVIFLAGSDIVRTTAPAPAVASSTIVTAGTGKKARATGVSVTFNTAVNPDLLTAPGLYTIRAVKGKRLIKLKKKGGVSYDASTQTLTLTFAAKTAIGSGFNLVVTTGGIIGVDGQVLAATPILIAPTTA